MTHTIQLTPPQAAFIQAKMQAYEQAKAEAQLFFAYAVAGHVPEGAAFVSVNPETGELVVQTPHPAKVAASAPVTDITDG